MDELSRSEQLEQKRSFWKQHIDSWQETGLTQAEYCRQHNLKHHQLVYWKKRYLKTETNVSFVPLKFEDLLDLSVRQEPAPLTLVINSEFKIEIRAGFDRQLLQQLILALRGLS